MSWRLSRNSDVDGTSIRPPTYRSHAVIDTLSARGQGRTTGSSISDSASLLDDTISVISSVSPSRVDNDQSSLLEPSPVYVYYRLYSPTGPIPSNHRVYPHNQYLGQIDATHISPPHNARSIKQCIARHEEIVDLTVADIILFSALSSQVPMSDQDFVPILAGTGSGSTPQEPMALVITDANDFVNANNSIEDGTYLIRNLDKSCFWAVDRTPMQNIYFMAGTVDSFRTTNYFQWAITHSGDGGIVLQSPYDLSSWAAAGLKGSTTPIPWRFIPESYGSKLYYITTDMASDSPQVATATQLNTAGGWSQLRRGDESQLWELIPLTP